MFFAADASSTSSTQLSSGDTALLQVAWAADHPTGNAQPTSGRRRRDGPWPELVRRDNRMLLAHAQTLAQARSCLAALADNATSLEASSGYEQTLMALDQMHDDQVPTLDTERLASDRSVLTASATSAIKELVSHGVDPLQQELLLAMLQDARALDVA